MPRIPVSLQEIQQHLDGWNRRLRAVSEGHLAAMQARWRALAGDLDDAEAPPFPTPDNGEPGYAATTLTGYHPLTEDFHAWRTARLRRLQILDARLAALGDDETPAAGGRPGG
jgi:hypothetical protein